MNIAARLRVPTLRFVAPVLVFGLSGCSSNSSTEADAGGGGASSGSVSSGSGSGSSTGSSSGNSSSGGGSGGSSGGSSDDASSSGTDSSSGADGGGAANDASTGGAMDAAFSPDAGIFPIPPGMTKIFDGTTLNGWDGNPAIWTVNAGNMSLYGKTTAGGQLIKTTTNYDTFRLVLTERMVATSNHLGIGFWGNKPATMGDWVYDNCILLIPPGGGLWDYAGGNLVAGGTAQNANGSQFQWHQVEILATASTGEILAAVNGVQAQKYTRPRHGVLSPIGVQAHAGASEEEYKDIWIEVNPPVHMLLTLRH